jgi:hypothetical protein
MDEGFEAMLNQPIAYHEAGHAVVATARGGRVQLVTIRPHDGRLGRCEVDGNPRCIDTAWGGPVGQAICSNNPRTPLDHDYCEKDRAEALDFAGGDEVLTLDRLSVVRALLAEPPYDRQLRAVADALLEATTLTGEQVKALIESA